MNLAIGSAGQHRGNPEWVTIDANPKSGATIIASVPPLPLEVHALKWKTIEMIHVLEHFFLWDAEALLKECHEVLEPGGRLVIECPNITFAAKVLCGVEPSIAGTAPGQCDMWPLYGDPNHRDPLMCHKWGWTPDTLRTALVQAGFGLCVHFNDPPQHHVGAPRDFRIEVIKK